MNLTLRNSPQLIAFIVSSLGTVMDSSPFHCWIKLVTQFHFFLLLSLFINFLLMRVTYKDFFLQNFKMAIKIHLQWNWNLAI